MDDHQCVILWNILALQYHGLFVAIFPHDCIFFIQTLTSVLPFLTLFTSRPATPDFFFLPSFIHLPASFNKAHATISRSDTTIVLPPTDSPSPWPPRSVLFTHLTGFSLTSLSCRSLCLSPFSKPRWPIRATACSQGWLSHHQGALTLTGWEIA